MEFFDLPKARIMVKYIAENIAKIFAYYKFYL